MFFIALESTLISGHFKEQEVWDEIRDCIDAARAVLVMRNRVGVLGHYYCGMLDIYSDMTQQSAVFGNHFESLEMYKMHALWKAVTPLEIEAKLEEFHREFDVSQECSKAELKYAAQTSCTIDAMITKYRLGSLAYYYERQPSNPHENIITSVIAGNTLLTTKHTPMAGECDIKNVQAMKLMDSLGASGSFSELYLTDFNKDLIFFEHDGPAHIAIAEGRVSLVHYPFITVSQEKDYQFKWLSSRVQ